MGEIKEYKQAIIISLYDGEDIIADIDIEKLFQGLNSGVKFMKIDGEIIATSSIKKAKPHTVDWIEAYILSQPKDIQTMLRQKQKDQPLASQRLGYIEHQVALYNEKKDGEQNTSL